MRDLSLMLNSGVSFIACHGPAGIETNMLLFVNFRNFLTSSITSFISSIARVMCTPAPTTATVRLLSAVNEFMQSEQV